MNVSRCDPAQQVYDQLWAKAMTSFAGGQVQTDPYLSQPASDNRRGITLIARPKVGVVSRFAEFVNYLKMLEPEQHYYQFDEFHVTIMTLISASKMFGYQRIPFATYHSIFARLFQEFRRFTISFKGVTATTSTVMAQGYVDDDYLNELRAAIRQALGQAGLAHSLDARYKIVTAHTTLMRFRTPPQNLPRMFAELMAMRHHNFGMTEIDHIEFVINDWYMSQDRVKVVATYPLFSKE